MKNDLIKKELLQPPKNLFLLGTLTVAFRKRGINAKAFLEIEAGIEARAVNSGDPWLCGITGISQFIYYFL